MEHIIRIYEKVLTELRRKTSPGKKYGIDKAWFSDTFLIYSKDDSDESFVLIEQASRLFFYKMINKSIPLRGALSIGSFYSHKKRNIFIGQALIDGYRYTEKQDWLGFVITPQSHERLKKKFLKREEEFYYRLTTVPMKGTRKTEKLFALSSRNELIRSQLLNALADMERRAKPRHKHKYRNTMDFIHDTPQFVRT
jgi:hypothetical protein